jgi:outer membrane protein assembly factor BamB
VIHPRRTQRFLAIAASAVLAAAGALWGVGGCQHQRTTAPPPAVNEIPAGGFTINWRADLALKGDQPQQMFLRDDLLIVYTRNHFAYVLAAGSGENKWVAKVSDPAVKLHPPVVLKDYVAIPTITSIEVYNRQGKDHRSLAHGFAPRSGAVGLGTRIFFGADNPNGGRLVDLDLGGSQYQNNSIVWELQTRGGVSGTPAIQQGIVYCADDRGNVYAVNADTRAPVWPLKQEGREDGVFGTAAANRADLKADEMGVYVASFDTKLYCIGRTDGRIRWQYYAGTPLSASPVVTQTGAYQYIEGQGIASIEKAQGDPARKPRWIVKEAVQFLAEDEKYAYLERNDHAIIAAEKASGAVKFQSQRKDFVAFGRSLKGNVIYAALPNGQIWAIVPVLTAGKMGEVVFEPVESPAEAVTLAQ